MNDCDQIIINDSTTNDYIVINDNVIKDNVDVVTEGSLVTSVNSRIGAIILTKSDVNLGLVDNTSDLNKPISNATLSALLFKVDLSAFNTLNNIVTSQYGSWNNVYFTVNSLSGNWNLAYSNTTKLSSDLNSLYSTVNLNSSTNWNYLGTDIKALTGNWNSTYSWVNTNSSIATFTISISAPSLSGKFYGDGSKLTGIVAGTTLSPVITGNWQNTFNTVSSLSSNWQSAYNISTSYQNTSGNFLTNTNFLTAYTNNTILSSLTSTLLPTSIYQNTSGLFVLNSIINSVSGNWNTAYQALSTNPHILNQSLSSTTTLIGSNTANNTFSEVLGGQCNLASGTYSTIVNGFSSCATGYTTFVGAGSGIRATGSYAVAVGGKCNTASGNYSFVGGGSNNLTSGNCSFVGGGDTNCSTNALDVVAGGNHNCAIGGTSFVGGGRLNTASAQYATVVGGNQNGSVAYAASVVGGQNNIASGDYSSILGGHNNDTNSFSSAFIIGSNITATQANTTFANSLMLLNGTCDCNNNPNYGCATAKIIYGAPGEAGTPGVSPGPGGSINVSGGGADDYYGVGGSGGTINMTGGAGGNNASGGAGGGIYLTGARGDSPCNGGSAGSIISTGGYYLAGYSANGGSLTMSAGYNANGGSINTSSGGGSIDTRGTGYIQLGTASAYTMTQLQGTASGIANRTICLPDADGVLIGQKTDGTLTSTGLCVGKVDHNGQTGASTCILQGSIVGSEWNYGNWSITAGEGSGGSSFYLGSNPSASIGMGVDGGAGSSIALSDANGATTIAFHSDASTGQGYIQFGTSSAYTMTQLQGTATANQTLYLPDTNGDGGTIALSRIGQNGVFSGYNNTATCLFSFVGGGENNNATCIASTIVGGINNNATGTYASIVGGVGNTASGYGSNIVSGKSNNASGSFSVILGGVDNDTNNKYNTFILGSNITASLSSYTYVNNLSSQGTIAASNLIISKTPSTFTNPVTASGTFLILNINGTNKAIQLWDYSS